MSYTLNRGVDKDGLDNTQRGLLIGLPAIALILGLGAFHSHNPGGHAGASAHTIPVVSALSTGAKSGGSGPAAGGTNPGGAGSGAGSNGSAGGTAAAVSGTTTGFGGGTGTTTGTATTSGVVGGMGGGPTGGTTGGGTTGGTGGGTGGTGGGTTTLPDCSLDQIATVTCQVPACSQPVTLQPGQKAILSLDGTCIVLN
jgi:hypothetical protein